MQVHAAKVHPKQLTMHSFLIQLPKQQSKLLVVGFGHEILNQGRQWRPLLQALRLLLQAIMEARILLRLQSQVSKGLVKQPHVIDHAPAYILVPLIKRRLEDTAILFL
ncbi:hypothetical protein CCR82_02410 [Halochromatium salexigens]|uniref:Uncharacterized protein n=1 Tax=Halochromatium salexigens TaxID=49447 RepID=A0AAJ0XF63_HALSE|nr:hypothetical protein [Halochromatium salexigens]